MRRRLFKKHPTSIAVECILYLPRYPDLLGISFLNFPFWLYKDDARQYLQFIFILSDYSLVCSNSANRNDNLEKVKQSKWSLHYTLHFRTFSHWQTGRILVSKSKLRHYQLSFFQVVDTGYNVGLTQLRDFSLVFLGHLFQGRSSRNWVNWVSNMSRPRQFQCDSI